MERRPVLEFVGMYNMYHGDLPEVKVLSLTRIKKIEKRLQEEPDIGYWRHVFITFAESDFAVGKGWANFDFIIQNDNNHVKIMEGKYKTNTKTTQEARKSWM